MLFCTSILYSTLNQLFVLYIAEEGQFRQLSGDNACICPDRSWSMTYECTVVGGFITIWKGSAISSLCEDSRSGIFLLHNRFVDHPILCDNGTIVGKGVKVENNSYTS